MRLPWEFIQTVAAQIESYGETMREQAIATVEQELSALRDEVQANIEAITAAPASSLSGWFVAGRSSSEAQVEQATLGIASYWQHVGYMSGDPRVRAIWAQNTLNNLSQAETKIIESAHSVTIFWRSPFETS